MSRRAGQKYVTCPHCGAQAPAIATFCPACGLGLSSPQVPSWASPIAPAAPQPPQAIAPDDQTALQDSYPPQGLDQPQGSDQPQDYAPPRARRVGLPVRVVLAVIGLIACMGAGTVLGLWLDSLNAPGPASFNVSLVIHPYPAGSTHVVTVRVLDSHGNTATGYTGTIHFDSSDKKASVPADYTFTSADKGLHAFAASLKPGLVLRTAGSQSITATDKARSSLKGSATITVAPGPAKTLRVSGLLSQWPAGSTHSVKATAYDAYGNVATGYTGTVHFDSSDTKASVPANYTFSAADGGVHKFSNALKPGLTLRTPGSCWVRATDLKAASITGSQTVTVK